ncbi:putative transcription factor Ovo-like 1 [Cetorhinus maximus]
MPRSFLVKKQHAKCGSRNWGNISDDQRGDFYVPECPDACALDKQQPLPQQSAAVKSAYAQGHFLCYRCSKVFPLHRMLTRHLKCHSTVKKHVCGFCGKGFNDTFDLKRHMRTHTGIRPYKCDLCEKAFTQRCSLESHLKKIHNVHQNYAYRERRSKIFVCEDCGFTSSQGDAFFLHIRDHHPGSPLLRKYLRKQSASFQNRLSMLLIPRFV